MTIEIRKKMKDFEVHQTIMPLTSAGIENCLPALVKPCRRFDPVELIRGAVVVVDDVESTISATTTLRPTPVAGVDSVRVVSC
jgi:hypothetical protein